VAPRDSEECHQMWKQRASLSELARVSRQLGISLNSGIAIVKAFDLTAGKSSGRLRSVLKDVSNELKSGSDVTSALVAHGDYFPELFVAMIQVGEVSGSLVEVLMALSEHYENLIRLRREFISNITLPVVQMGAAILIVAALIALLGWVGESTGMPIDVLGWGLMGTSGALIWLGGWGLVIAALFVGYQMAAASLESLKPVHQFLLNLPVVGNCMRSFAIARFSWAFHLTQNAGMPIDDSIDASLMATSNAAFAAAAPGMISSVNAGSTLTEAFEESQLFPVEFIEFVMVAEQSGTVPEALHRLSPQFEEDARRSLKALAATLNWGIWGLVALFIIFMIFRIFLWQIGLYSDLLNEI
jgi:Type II secretory pathway, component PulF